MGSIRSSKRVPRGKNPEVSLVRTNNNEDFQEDLVYVKVLETENYSGDYYFKPNPVRREGNKFYFNSGETVRFYNSKSELYDNLYVDPPNLQGTSNASDAGIIIDVEKPLLLKTFQIQGYSNGNTDVYLRYYPSMDLIWNFTMPVTNGVSTIEVDRYLPTGRLLLMREGGGPNMRRSDPPGEIVFPVEGQYINYISGYWAEGELDRYYFFFNLSYYASGFPPEDKFEVFTQSFYTDESIGVFDNYRVTELILDSDRDLIINNSFDNDYSTFLHYYNFSGYQSGDSYRNTLLGQVGINITSGGYEDLSGLSSGVYYFENVPYSETSLTYFDNILTQDAIIYSNTGASFYLGYENLLSGTGSFLTGDSQYEKVLDINGLFSNGDSYDKYVNFSGLMPIKHYLKPVDYCAIADFENYSASGDIGTGILEDTFYYTNSGIETRGQTKYWWWMDGINVGGSYFDGDYGILMHVREKIYFDYTIINSNGVGTADFYVREFPSLDVIKYFPFSLSNGENKMSLDFYLDTGIYIFGREGGGNGLGIMRETSVYNPIYSGRHVDYLSGIRWTDMSMNSNHYSLFNTVYCKSGTLELEV